MRNDLAKSIVKSCSLPEKDKLELLAHFGGGAATASSNSSKTKDTMASSASIMKEGGSKNAKVHPLTTETEISDTQGNDDMNQ